MNPAAVQQAAHSCSCDEWAPTSRLDITDLYFVFVNTFMFSKPTSFQFIE